MEEVIFLNLIDKYFPSKISSVKDNNIPSIISQVGFEENRVYRNLTPTLRGREIVSDTPLAH